jgi:hypothetical protein
MCTQAVKPLPTLNEEKEPLWNQVLQNSSTAKKKGASQAVHFIGHTKYAVSGAESLLVQCRSTDLATFICLK